MDGGETSWIFWGKSGELKSDDKRHSANMKIDALINLFYNAATGSRKLRNVLTPVGGFFFLSFVTLTVLGSIWLDERLGLPRLLNFLPGIVLSLPLLGGGLILTSWSIFHFFKTRGTPVPFNPPPRLVVTGPYARIRNPMLTGIFFQLFGLGLLFGSISITFIITPLFIFLNTLELKLIEEHELEKRLGDEYLLYKKRTPMFFPRFFHSVLDR